MNAEAASGQPQRELGLRFYRGALKAAERRLLEAAYDLEGLDHEAAVLRVKLRTAIAEDPENLKLMLLGMGMLVRLAAARYRMSPKARKDLADNLAAVLNSLGDQILPPEGR